jgi:hypothetical protein
MYNWFTLADLDEEKQTNARSIISRYSRGNVSFQNGFVLRENDLRLLSKEGDEAMDRLNKYAQKNMP